MTRKENTWLVALLTAVAAAIAALSGVELHVVPTQGAVSCVALPDPGVDPGVVAAPRE